MTRWVKLPVPGGKVLYLKEPAYAKFCDNVQALVKCMERAEYVDAPPPGTVLAINQRVSRWPKLLGAFPLRNGDAS